MIACHDARNGCLDLEGVGLDQNKVHEQHPVPAAGMRAMLALGYHLRFLGAAKAFR